MTDFNISISQSRLRHVLGAFFALPVIAALLVLAAACGAGDDNDGAAGNGNGAQVGQTIPVSGSGSYWKLETGNFLLVAGSW